MSDLGYGFIYITTNNINGKKYKRKEFLAKYGVGRKICDSVKKSINDLTNSD